MPELFFHLILWLVVAGLLFISIVLLAQRILFKIYTQPMRIKASKTPTDLGCCYDAIQLEANDTMHPGWLIHPPGWDRKTKTPMIIVPHGFAAERSDLLDRSCFLAKKGFLVWTFDWRAHGEHQEENFSGGIHELEDYLQIIDHFDKQSWVGEMALYGFSFAAGLSIIAALKRPQIRCVVADAPFDSLEKAMIKILRKFPFGKTLLFPAMKRMFSKKFSGDITQINVAKAASQLSQRPLFVLSGTHDTIVPHELSLSVFEAANMPKLLRIQPGGSHFDNASEEILENEIFPFFRAHM